MDFITQLLVLKNHGIYSIDSIEWWLLKYSEDYKKTYDYVQNLHSQIFTDGTEIRIPSTLKPTTEDKFLNLYEELDEISTYHKKENEIKYILTEYCTVKNSKSDLKKWVKKNEKLGMGPYFGFLIEYLAYGNDDEVEHPMVLIHSLKELEIFIDKEGFKYTIEFAEVFNDLFFMQEILPESLVRLTSSLQP